MLTGERSEPLSPSLETCDDQSPWFDAERQRGAFELMLFKNTCLGEK